LLRLAAVLALLVPAALHFAIRDRIVAAESSLSRLLGSQVTVGDAEVGLFGALVMTDVRAGDVVAAESVEAAIGLDSLLHGRIGADEIVVQKPIVKVDSAALRLLAHLPARGGTGAGGGSRRLKRIVMHDGEVTVDLGDHGRVRARDVAISPEENGVRVVLGPTVALLRWNGLEASAAFARGGLDVELPAARLGRAALDGGRVTIGAAGRDPLELDHVVVVRGATTRLDGTIGADGRLAVTLGPAATAVVEAERLPLAPFAPALPSWLVPGGEVTGSARVTLDGDTVTADAAVAARGLAIDHPVLALGPVPLGGRVEARLAWDRAARRGGGKLRVATGGILVESDVELGLDESGGVTGARLDARLPEVDCAGALAALPAPLRGPIDGLDLTGTLGGRAKIGFDAAHPDETRLDLELGVGCGVLRDDSAARVDLLLGRYVHTLPTGAERALDTSDPDFVPLASLPEYVPAAFIAAEDARFYSHHGFDAEQLRRSFAVDMSAGKIERGGSTISQQLVKNLYLGRERTLARKLTEAILTWRLEARVPKARILEAYLNVIELGDGVYGIGPAAERWFGKPAAKLTPAEAAYLAAVTAAPGTAEARLRATGRPDGEALRRAQIVLAALRARLGADELGRALRQLGDLRVAVL